MSYLKDPIDFSKLRKVLFIKLRHLGDVVLSTPAIYVLKSRFPHLQIDFLINEEGKDLVAGLGEISELLLYERKKAKKNFLSMICTEGALALKVLKKNYDVVINLTEGDKGNFLAAVSGAPFKVGQLDSHGMRFLTHLYKRVSTPRHRVDRDLDPLRRVGIYPTDEEKKIRLAPFSHYEHEVDQFLKKQGLSAFIVLHAVSRWMYKTARVEKFVELIDKLDRPVVITGHRVGDEGLYIEALLKAAPRAVYFSTQGSILKLVGLMDRAVGIITVDSLPLHIASYLKKPTVCLFGPTGEWEWGPWQNPKAIVVTYDRACRACYKDGCGGGGVSDCVELIPVEAILRACRLVFEPLA